MVNGISANFDPRVFKRLTNNADQIKAELKNIQQLGLDQTQKLLYDISHKVDFSNSESLELLKKVQKQLSKGVHLGEIPEIKALFNTNSAAIAEVDEGIAVMAEGWNKPIVFPKEKTFKMLGFADKPDELTSSSLWNGAYGYKPATILGAVGNSNIKPEQVKGGTTLSKKELSKKYEQSIVDFYRPIVAYLKENGAKSDDIGTAFAHSDCGVDKAMREVTEEHSLKGFATTPTEYTQYLRGKEMPVNKTFPNGYILADFPFPTVLTRNTAQIDDYASVYSKMVGKDNPLGVFGGGSHAYARDAQNAYFTKEGATVVPVDILKDLYGIEIPAKNTDGDVINAARNTLERVNGNPYEQYRFAFNNFLPSSNMKEDLKQYDPQAAIATIAYANLKKAGKID